MTPVELLRRLRRLIRYDTTNPPVNELECAFQSDDIEVELVRHDAGLAEPDLSLFEMLAGVLRELDPEAIPGFMPMRLPADFPVLKIVHAADERIPVAALEFGTEAVTRALQRF